ncbi:MAG: cytochrome-c oxidase, cbb3-type subunit III [Rickettsiales bacterium]|nr:cytochrome-c oxidase, cbb3-type subunit III [Rickettsiales bacterium]
MNNDKKKEIDKHSGVETTGHEWDGLKELNNPMPRWWLIVFIVTIVWGVGYWIVYPSWPTIKDATIGTFGWTQYKKLADEQKEITDRKKKYLSKVEELSLEEIRKSDELFQFAKNAGEIIFKDNCATCHQTGGAGALNYPNLNDDDWLWGGSFDAISHTIKHGVRMSNDGETRDSAMPAFGKDGVLAREDIEKVANYVLSLSKMNKNKKAEYLAQGAEIFEYNCASCHGNKGEGNADFGAPNISDAIWLKIKNPKEELPQYIYNAKMGKMPKWEGRLTESQIKLLTIYVHSLGGGK